MSSFSEIRSKLLAQSGVDVSGKSGSSGGESGGGKSQKSEELGSLASSEKPSWSTAAAKVKTGNTEFDTLRERLLSDAAPEKAEQRRSAVASWVEKYNQTMQGLSDYDKSRGGGYSTDVSGGFGQQIEELIQEYEGIREYASRMGLPNGQRYKKYLQELQSNIRKTNDFMAGFASEDAYNQYVAEQEDYEQKRTANLTELEEEIARLKEQRESAAMYQGIYDAPISQLKREAGSGDGWESIRQLGSEELEAQISQKQQFLEQARQIQEQERLVQQAAQISEPAGELTGEALIQDTKARAREHAQSPKVKAYEAEKAYNDYLNSDERAQTLSKMMQEDMASMLLNGLPGLENFRQSVDEKESYLKAQADYWRAQADAEDNNAVMEKGLQEIASWPEEDQERLKAYVEERDTSQGMFTGSNPILWFQSNRKMSENAAALFDKYGEERVRELAQIYGRYSHAQDAQQVAQASQEAVSTVPGAIGHSALTVGTGLVSGLSGMVGRVAEAANDTGIFKTMEEYTPGDVFSVYSGNVRGQVAQNIEGENGENGILGKVGSIVYQGGMAAAESAARLALTGSAEAAAALAASNSFTDAMSKYSAQGATKGQATTMALAVASLEYWTEKIPMEKLLNIAEGGGSLADVAKQAFITEPTTEELSMFGEILAEAAVLRGKSSYNQQIGELVANGMSYGEAKKEADNAILKEAAETYFVSAVSAGISSGGAAIIGNTLGRSQETAQQSENVETVQTAQEPIQAENAAPAAAAPTDIISETVEKLKTDGTVSNKQAEAILADPEAVNRLAAQTGVEPSGTKSQKRDAVKLAIRQLAGEDVPTTMSEAGKQSLLEDLGQGLWENSPAAQEQENQPQEQEPRTLQETTGIPPKAQMVDMSAAEAVPGKQQEIKGTSAANQNGEQAENGYGENTVGGAESQFRHEVRRSAVYDNTYANATDEQIRAVGAAAEKDSPHIAEYDYISEEESLHNAELRTRTKQERDAEFTYLMEKGGWSGEDNDTAMRLLKAYQKEGDGERARRLTQKQREATTQGAQLVQSYAKYSREDTTVAVKDAIDVLNGMSMNDVDKRFWNPKNQDTGNTQNTRKQGDYFQTPAGEMYQTEKKDTQISKRLMKQQAFDQWQTSVVTSMLEIANDIDNVQDGDAESMRNIVRQLAKFRQTTAFFGISDQLTKNADRILNKMDFDTAKTMAKAQLAMIPDDFRKRTVGETIKTIRVHNMLSALTTVHRNLVGNSSIGIMDAFNDSTTGRAVDALISKFTGIRTVGNDVKYAKSYFKAAVDAADMASLCVELNIPMESESIYSPGNTRTHSSQGGPLGRFLSAYEKYLKYSLEVTDKFFEGGAEGSVSQSIRGLGSKSGLTEEQIQGLGKYAGERRTFKETRQLTRMAKGAKQAANYIGVGDIGAGDIFMPFAGVPANLGQTAVDYNGSGIALGVKEAIDVIRAAKAGQKVVKIPRTNETIPIEIAQRKAAADFGRGLGGVGMIALWTAAAACGILKVHNDEDWEKQSLEQSQNLSGAQINLSAFYRAITGDDSQGDPTEWRGDDITFGLDFLEPFNSGMHIGYMMSQEDSVMDMAKSYPKNAMLGVAEALMDMPMMTLLSDIQDLVTGIGETDEERNSTFSDNLGRVAGTLATSAVPSIVRQTAQTIDPYFRDTYDPDPWKQAGNKLKSAIPFASMTLPKKYNGLGEVQKRYDDSTPAGRITGALNNLILPDKVERIKGNDISDYLSELSARTGDTSMYPEEQAPYSFILNGEDFELAGKQRETYQKTYGEQISALYGGLMESEAFSNLPEDVQISALKKAKTYATQFAKASVSDFDDVQSGTTEEIVSDIVNDSITGMFTRAFDGLAGSWDEKGDAAEAVASLDRAYSVYEGMADEDKQAFREEAGGRLGYYLEAKKAGVSTETFVGLYKDYRDISNDESLDTGAKAQQWSYDLEKAVDSGTVTESQKKVLKDSMKFWYNNAAETEKFDQMTEAGVSTDSADLIIHLLDGVVGTGAVDEETGKAYVRDIDTREAIAECGLSDSEIDMIMHVYMPDYDPTSKSPDKTELKYDAIRDMGLSPAGYAYTYRMYVDTTGKDKKDRVTNQYVETFGCSKAVATMLYEIYNGEYKPWEE